MRETYAIVVVHRVGSSSDWLQSIQLDYKAIRSTINQRKIRKKYKLKVILFKKVIHCCRNKIICNNKMRKER